MCDMQMDMGIIKFEISLAEATKAITEFKQNRSKAFEGIAHEVRAAVGSALHSLVNAEMSLFLGEPDQLDNKRNGFTEREYAIKGIGAVRFRMPKDRKNRFESVIVPKSEQIDPRIKEDIAVLHLAGLSTRTLAMASRRLLQVDVSTQTVTNSLSVIAEKALSFLTRDLSDRKFWALFVDGTNFRIQRRGTTSKEPQLVVVGIDAENRLSLLAIEPGTKENAESWRMVFSELKRRGLDSRAVRIGIMDGLPGLEKLFREEFQNAMTARCWVHVIRNALAKAPVRVRPLFKSLSDKVMYAGSLSNARIAFEDLKLAMNKDAERAVACIERDIESLLVHYQFEKQFWRTLKTTNPIERVNKELKRRTKSMDSLGESTLSVLMAFTALRLEMGWLTKNVSSDRMKHLKPFQKINQIESAMDELVH